MLTPFFQHNHNLTEIVIYNCDLGGRGGRLFALRQLGAEQTNLWLTLNQDGKGAQISNSFL